MSDIADYRMICLAFAGLPYPHPTKEDYDFIESAWRDGCSPRYVANQLVDRLAAPPETGGQE